MNYVVVIPARYASTRLPGKPLVKIAGVPMIVRTYRRCIQAVPPEKVYVATDDERIRKVCEANGIRVVMTADDCLTGTDRVAAVSDVIEADTYINVQGDEPVFNPDDLDVLLEASGRFPEDIINGYCSISSEEMYRSPSVPKVVLRPDGRLLYMSRAPIPTTKAHKFKKAWRQVCAYAFPRAALKAFSEQKRKTPLEDIEDIEILRFLEMGFDIRMVPMSDISVAVDNPQDVGRAEAVIAAMEKT